VRATLTKSARNQLLSVRSVSGATAKGGVERVTKSSRPGAPSVVRKEKLWDPTPSDVVKAYTLPSAVSMSVGTAGTIW
jgi:hypothetical protein